MEEQKPPSGIEGSPKAQQAIASGANSEAPNVQVGTVNYFGRANEHRLHLSEPLHSQLDDWHHKYDLTLFVDSSFAVPHIAVEAQSPTVSRMEFYPRHAALHTAESRQGEGFRYHAVLNTSGEHGLCLVTEQAEPVTVQVVLGDKIVIRKVLAPQ